MQPFEALNHGNHVLSPLQRRIQNYQHILTQYNNALESTIQPLIQFAIILCRKNEYQSADEILLHLIDSKSFKDYEKLSSIWILRAEIAEELGELQKVVNIFEQAAKYQAQPYMDIINAFTSFKQRHTNNNNKPNTAPIHTPSSISNTRMVQHKQTRNNHHTNTNQSKQKAIYPSSLPQAPCTPLTDDFEHFMLESDRQSKQKRKKYYFRSKQNKKQMNTRCKKPSTNHNQNGNMMLFKTNLSPIIDIGESNMSLSLSSSFSGLNVSMDQDMDISTSMNGLFSDISAIAPRINKCSDALLLSPDRSPDLPPSNTSISVPFTPLTALKDAGKTLSPIFVVSPKGFALDNNNKENIQYGKGSEVRMEVINLSPAKKNKYGSDRVLSPVRRSKRIQQMNDNGENTTPTLQELLHDSNYTYIPNPMLNTSRNRQRR